MVFDASLSMERLFEIDPLTGTLTPLEKRASEVLLASFGGAPLTNEFDTRGRC